MHESHRLTLPSFLNIKSLLLNIDIPCDGNMIHKTAGVGTCIDMAICITISCQLLSVTFRMVPEYHGWSGIEYI